MDSFESELLDLLLADKRSEMALMEIELDAQDQALWEKDLRPSLIPKEQQIKHLKQEVLKSVDPEDLMRRLAHANYLIVKEAPLFLNSEDEATVEASLKRAYEITLENGILEGKTVEVDNQKTLASVYEFTDPFLIAIQKLGNEFYQQNRIEDALSIYSWLKVIYPYNSDYWVGVAYCYKEMGDLLKAIPYFKGALAINPEDIVIWLQLGLTAKELGQSELVSQSKVEVEKLTKQLNRDPTPEELGLTNALND